MMKGEDSVLDTVTERMKSSLERYSSLTQQSKDGHTSIVMEGPVESPTDIVYGILYQTDILRKNMDREELRDVIIPILSGNSEQVPEDEVYGEEVKTLDDEVLSSLGVSEEDYHQLRTELINSFERGLRGEIPGPFYAAGEIALDYEEH